MRSLSGSSPSQTPEGRLGSARSRQVSDTFRPVTSADFHTEKRPPEVRGAVGLALLGTAWWPFAAGELPLHYAQGSYGYFVPRWVALAVLPWAFAEGVAYLAGFDQYRSRQPLRLAACLLTFTSLTSLLLSLAYQVGS